MHSISSAEVSWSSASSINLLTASRACCNGSETLSSTRSACRMRSSRQSRWRRGAFSCSTSQAASTAPKSLSVSSNDSATCFTTAPFRSIESRPFSVRGFHRRCRLNRICPLETLTPMCRDATRSRCCASSKITKSFLKSNPSPEPSSSSSAFSSTPSDAKKSEWFSTRTSAPKNRLRARWKKHSPWDFDVSDPGPQSLGEHRPRSEQTASHTLASGSTSKSERLPSSVVRLHSCTRFSSAASGEVKRPSTRARALWSLRVQR